MPVFVCLKGSRFDARAQPGYANLVVVSVVEQETLLQSIQLYIENLVAWCQLGKQPTQL